MTYEDKEMKSKKMDAFFQGSTAVNGEIFAAVLEEVEKAGVERLMEEAPGFWGRFLTRLRNAGGAQLLNRLSPFFGLYSFEAGAHAYTTSPSTAKRQR